MFSIECLRQTQVTPRPTFQRIVQNKAFSPAGTGHLPGQPDESVRQLMFTSPQRPCNSLPSSTIKPKARLIVAIDFGTTYSSVSYAKVDPGADLTEFPISDIHCINDYEDASSLFDCRENARIENVPTKLLYLGPKVPGLEQSDTDSDPDEDCISDLGFLPIPDSNPMGRRQLKRGRKLLVQSSRRRRKSSEPMSTQWSVHWGFTVQRAQEDAHNLAEYSEKESLDLVKLTLGESPDQDPDLRNKRMKLTEQIEGLRSRGVVQDRDHVLFHYLARLLRHAKTRLEEKKLLEGTQPEYVLCVPVAWSENACRTMHNAVVKAVQACKLGFPEKNRAPDLFIVSEPEAAAQYVIASLNSEGRLSRGEVFIILDAGGGTVDITTYEVTSNEGEPLRLQGEAFKADGALCGSSLITERYLRKARAKLAEVDPTGEPDLLDGYATAHANYWDLHDKPSIDVTDKKIRISKFGSRKSSNNRPLKWKESEIRDIFEPSLKGTTDLLEKQLRLAKDKQLIVNKLILVGGFGESPSLRSRIQQILSAYDDGKGNKIELIRPSVFPTSAVARGAVLRALDKRNGPSRISRSSFGFIRHEPYGDFPEHAEAGTVPVRNEVNNEQFVHDTIHWLIQAGQTLPSAYQTEPILSCHAFMLTETKLICVEYFYVSQRPHRSHFQRHHEQNEGASLLSKIEIDVSDFKREFPLEKMADVEPRPKGRGKSVRVVTFDLVIHVEGKQLRYEARWPSGAKTPEEVRIRKSGYVSLAPSFAPGTE